MRTADGDVVVGTPDAKAEEDEDESSSGSEEEDDDDDESEEGSSGSGSELDLALAEDGRVACPLLPHLPLDAFRALSLKETPSGLSLSPLFGRLLSRKGAQKAPKMELKSVKNPAKNQ